MVRCFSKPREYIVELEVLYTENVVLDDKSVTDLKALMCNLENLKSVCRALQDESMTFIEAQKLFVEVTTVHFFLEPRRELCAKTIEKNILESEVPKVQLRKKAISLVQMYLRFERLQSATTTLPLTLSHRKAPILLWEKVSKKTRNNKKQVMSKYSDFLYLLLASNIRECYFLKPRIFSQIDVEEKTSETLTSSPI